MSAIDHKKLLSHSDMAKLLVVHRCTLHRWRSTGLVPEPLYISGVPRWRPDEVYPEHFTRFQWCIWGKCQTPLYSHTASADFCHKCAAEDAPDRVNRRLRGRLYTLQILKVLSITLNTLIFKRYLKYRRLFMKCSGYAWLDAGAPPLRKWRQIKRGGN